MVIFQWRDVVVSYGKLCSGIYLKEKKFINMMNWFPNFKPVFFSTRFNNCQSLLSVTVTPYKPTILLRQITLETRSFEGRMRESASSATSGALFFPQRRARNTSDWWRSARDHRKEKNLPDVSPVFSFPPSFARRDVWVRGLRAYYHNTCRVPNWPCLVHNYDPQSG